MDQVIPTLASRDAIGHHTLQLRQVIRSMGLDSDVYYVDATPDMRREGIAMAQIGDRSAEGRVLLYQLSIGSWAADAVAERPEPKLVDYHNITPPGFFEDWEPAVAAELRQGRRQLEQLAPVTRFALADSAFNAAELSEAGYRQVDVVPILLDVAVFDRPPDRAAEARLSADRGRGGHEWLFVGKVAPHKAQHDLLRAFIAYRIAYDPSARLRIVGTVASPAYELALHSMVDDAGLGDAVEFAGSVNQGALAAYYRAADVFVCVSEHEGFCVPLLEAMHHRLPIVAFASAAVPDTVGDAGIVLPDKDPALVAAAVHRVVSDEALGQDLARRAAVRLAAFALTQTTQRATEAVAAAVRAVTADQPLP